MDGSLNRDAGPALARRLDPQAPYIACRWDYDQTPKDYLRDILVRVTNPANGRSVQCSPVDWGPHEEKTGRAADVSPGVMEELGLVTDDIVIVEYDLPEEVA